MKSQKDAVCTLLVEVLAERGVNYELGGPEAICDVLTKEDKATVRHLVKHGFLDQTISMTPESRLKYNTESKLDGYVSGLVNNWIKKYPAFNGGIKYTPVNKGSRTGYQDPEVKALRQLKKQATDAQLIQDIEEAIQDRLATIKPKEEINVSALPEKFRHLVK